MWWVYLIECDSLYGALIIVYFGERCSICNTQDIVCKIYQKYNSRSHYWTRFKINHNLKVKCISFLLFHVHIVKKSAFETVKPHMIHMHFFVAENDDTKKRMYSCVLVVGGGLMFPMAQSWLQYLIWTQMPGAFRLQLETQDIITNPKVDISFLLQYGVCYNLVIYSQA